MLEHRSYDAVVIGAGVFGTWTALHLAKRKQRVLLVDAYAPAHSRASSGGETRIIRMSYGADQIYTQWSKRSLAQWLELFSSAGQNLFHQTGVLWLASEPTSNLAVSISNLRLHQVKHEVIQLPELQTRYPQINFDGISRGLLEPDSGLLLARRAVACTVTSAIRSGVNWAIAHIAIPRTTHKLDYIETTSGERISAGAYIFACGPWLGKMFPEILAERIFVTRQEVFFFAVPPGDPRFTSPALPTWLFQADEVYGAPDTEGRGLKLARDTHGPLVDPDTQSRLVSPDGAQWAAHYVGRRFPALRHSPIIETRVCQYENTSNGDFLIDRHPECSNIWLAGGGSGHGFKHGPAFGEYTAALVMQEQAPEPRFSLATKQTHQDRTVH
jgi:sarcosine oxidase